MQLSTYNSLTSQDYSIGTAFPCHFLLLMVTYHIRQISPCHYLPGWARICEILWDRGARTLGNISSWGRKLPRWSTVRSLGAVQRPCWVRRTQGEGDQEWSSGNGCMARILRPGGCNRQGPCAEPRRALVGSTPQQHFIPLSLRHFNCLCTTFTLISL